MSSEIAPPAPAGGRQVLEVARRAHISVIRELASTISDLALPDVAPVHDHLATMIKAMEQLKDLMEARVIEAVRRDGQQVSEKGSMSMLAGNTELRIQPTRTGLDPKRLEAKLRAKGIEPGKFMRQKVTFEIDPVKVKGLSSVLSDAEVKSCMYDLNYRAIIKEVPNGGNSDAGED